MVSPNENVSPTPSSAVVTFSCIVSPLESRHFIVTLAFVSERFVVDALF